MSMSFWPLIKVVPGLMIWTLVCFAITFYVLKKYAFGRIQGAINERREKIRQSLDEADRARSEAHKLLEEHHALVAKARGDAESILAEARKVADSQRDRLKEELDTERARRVEETRREIEAETRRSIEMTWGRSLPGMGRILPFIMPMEKNTASYSSSRSLVLMSPGSGPILLLRRTSIPVAMIMSSSHWSWR